MGERPAANNRRPRRVWQIPSSSDLGLRAQSEPRAGEGQNIRTPGWPCFKSKNTLKEFSKLSPSLGNGQVTGHGWGCHRWGCHWTPTYWREQKEKELEYLEQWGVAELWGGGAALWFWVNPERHLQCSCSWWSSCSTHFRLGWGLGRADPEKGVSLEKSGG